MGRNHHLSPQFHGGWGSAGIRHIHLWNLGAGLCVQQRRAAAIVFSGPAFRVSRGGELSLRQSGSRDARARSRQ
jgi:hypothetical protein